MTRKTEFTEIIQGYMGGNLTYAKARERLFMILHETEDDRDILLCAVVFPLEMDFTPDSAGKDAWHYMRRILAVVVGDLPMRDVTVKVPGHHRLVGLAGLTALVAGKYVAGMYGFCAAWVAVGLFLCYRRVRVQTLSLLEEFPFAPFPDEQSWRKHVHLIADLDVPDYRAEVFEQSESRSKWSWLGWALSIAGMIALSPVLLISLLLASCKNSVMLVCDKEEGTLPPLAKTYSGILNQQDEGHPSPTVGTAGRIIGGISFLGAILLLVVHVASWVVQPTDNQTIIVLAAIPFFCLFFTGFYVARRQERLAGYQLRPCMALFYRRAIPRWAMRLFEVLMAYCFLNFLLTVCLTEFFEAPDRWQAAAVRALSSAIGMFMCWGTVMVTFFPIKRRKANGEPDTTGP